MSKKVIILIDGGYFDNLNRHLKKCRGKKINIEKLSSKMCEEMEHIRTRFYNAAPYQSANPTPEEKKRYQSAQKFKYAINRYKNHEYVEVGRVRLVQTRCPKCKKQFEMPKQKGVDVSIALDLVRMARKRVADIFILLSGDEDLTYAVEMAQEELCNVIVYYTFDKNNSIYGSKKLCNKASDRVIMDLDFLEECALE